MKGKNIVCLALAAALMICCAGCAPEEAAEKIEQALDRTWTEAQQVLQEGEEPAPAMPEEPEAPEAAEEPEVPEEPEAPEAPEAPAEHVPPEAPETPKEPAEHDPPEALAPAEEPAPTEAPDGPRPGKYTAADGSVLSVKSDGTCTYKTRIEVIVGGERMADTVTFHGTVEEGAFSFDRVTYYGMDITAMAREAGYEDASQWEAEAAELYGK